MNRRAERFFATLPLAWSQGSQVQIGQICAPQL